MKRFLSILLALILTLGLLPAQAAPLMTGEAVPSAETPQGEEAAPAVPLEERPETSQPVSPEEPPAEALTTAAGQVSRADWIAALVTAFDMTVADDSAMPDNYFADLSESDPCYKNVLLAVEFGVIDLEAGEDFRPDDPATREFAAQTLNACLGFQLENAAYTYTDAADVTAKDAAQVAVDRGWLALSGGKFLPNEPITTAERDAMLNDAQAVLTAEKQPITNRPFTFAEGVVELPTTLSATIDQNSVVTVNTESAGVSVGDVFVFYDETGYPIIRKALSVSTAEGSTRIETTGEGTENAVTGGAWAGTTDLDLGTFTPAETATYYITDTTAGPDAPAELLEISPYGLNYDKGSKTLTATHKVKLDGATAGSLTIKLANISLDHREDFWSSYYSANVSGDFSVTASLSFDFGKYAGIPNNLILGYARVGVFEFEVGVEYNLTGGLAASWSGPLEAGFTCSHGDFRLTHSFRKTDFTFTAEAKVEVGVYACANMDLALVSGFIRASSGIKMNFWLEHHDSGTPSTCVDFLGYLYAYISVDASLGAGWAKKSYSRTFDIYSARNSPIRVHYHYEDDVPVPSCTRGAVSGNANRFYTPVGSRYFNPAPSYAKGSYTAAGSATPVVIWEYKVTDSTMKEVKITKYRGNASAVAVPSKLDGYTVTAIGVEAFYNNKTIQSVTIPDSVTEIGSSAFQGCTKLTNVTLSKKLTTMGWGVFSGCNLTEIEIPKSLTTVDRLTYGPFRESGLTTVTFEPGTTKVAANLFAGASTLTSVTLLDTMTSINSYAFYDCTALTHIDLPGKLTTIDSCAFRGSGLTAIDLPGSLATISSEAFRATPLTQITIPDSVTEIGNYAFQDCAKLTKAVLPKGLKMLDSYTFSGCSALETVTFPEALTTIDTYAFKDCVQLKEFDLPSRLKTISTQAFYNCDALTSVTVPNSVTTLGNSAFQKCDALTDVTLGTGITTVPDSCFADCPNLSSVTLPYRTATVKANAFANDPKLKEIVLPRYTTSVTASAFSYPMTVKGVTGTYAEEFAGANGHTFEAIDIPATGVTLTPTELRVAKGKTATLVLSVEPKNFTDEVAWKSVDTATATINDAGLVTAKAVGSTTIRVAAGNAQTSCKVTVYQPVTSISLNKSSLTMEALETYQLTASPYPSSAEDKRVSWTSSDPEIASVDGNGLVTARKKGKATVTAAALDGSGVTRTCTVTVSNSVNAVQLPTELESPHKYPTSCSDIWMCTVPGASYISLTFDTQTETEADLDFLYVYGTGEAADDAHKYTGTALAGKTVRVAGDTVYIKLVSDGNWNEWGFKVTDYQSDGAVVPTVVHSGTLGNDRELTWEHTSDACLTFQTPIPQNTAVFVALYDDKGNFTGVKLINVQNTSAQIGDPAKFKLFWLDGNHAPQCPAVTVEN